MTALIKNEIYKTLRLKKLYIFILILLLQEILAVYYYQPGGQMKSVIVTADAQSIPLALLNGLAQFMSIYIPIYLADVITDEYKNGTLKLTLLRPIDRIQFLHGKIIGLLVFIMIMISFFIITSYTVGMIAFGSGDYTIYNGVSYLPVKGVCLTILLSFAMVLPYMACGMIVILIAFSSTTMSTTILLSVGFLTFGQYLDAFDQIKHYSIVHQMYFFHEYFVKHPDFELALQSIIVLVLYIVTFYFLSAKTLKKKDFLF
jgi:ABC-2 type transport system permease protein